MNNLNQNKSRLTQQSQERAKLKATNRTRSHLYILAKY